MQIGDLFQDVADAATGAFGEAKQEISDVVSGAVEQGKSAWNTVSDSSFWKGLGGAVESKILNRNDFAGINDVDKFEEAQRLMKFKSQDEIKQDYQKLLNDGVVTQDFFKNQENQPKFKQVDDNQEVEDAKKNFQKSLDDVVRDDWAKANHFQQSQISSIISAYTDKYAELYANIKGSYESADFNTKDYITKLNTDYANNLKSLMQSQIQKIIAGDTQSDAYDKTVAEMEDAAKNVADFGFEVADKSNKASRDYYWGKFKDDFNNGNISFGTLWNGIQSLGTLVTQGAQELIEQPLEKGMEKAFGFYDTVDEARNTNVYAANAGIFERGLGNLKYLSGQFIDGLPTFTAGVAPIIAGNGILNKVGVIEDFVKGSKGLRFLSELGQDVFLWDPISQVFNGRGINNEDAITNMLFNLPIDGITGLIEAPMKKLWDNESGYTGDFKMDTQMVSEDVVKALSEKNTDMATSLLIRDSLNVQKGKDIGNVVDVSTLPGIKEGHILFEQEAKNIEMRINSNTSLLKDNMLMYLGMNASMKDVPYDDLKLQHETYSKAYDQLSRTLHATGGEDASKAPYHFQTINAELAKGGSTSDDIVKMINDVSASMKQSSFHGKAEDLDNATAILRQIYGNKPQNITDNVNKNVGMNINRMLQGVSNQMLKKHADEVGYTIGIFRIEPDRQVRNIINDKIGDIDIPDLKTKKNIDTAANTVMDKGVIDTIFDKDIYSDDLMVMNKKFFDFLGKNFENIDSVKFADIIKSIKDTTPDKLTQEQFNVFRAFMYPTIVNQWVKDGKDLKKLSIPNHPLFAMFQKGSDGMFHLSTKTPLGNKIPAIWRQILHDGDTDAIYDLLMSITRMDHNISQAKATSLNDLIDSKVEQISDVVSKETAEDFGDVAKEYVDAAQKKAEQPKKKETIMSLNDLIDSRKKQASTSETSEKYEEWIREMQYITHYYPGDLIGSKATGQVRYVAGTRRMELMDEVAKNKARQAPPKKIGTAADWPLFVEAFLSEPGHENYEISKKTARGPANFVTDDGMYQYVLSEKGEILQWTLSNIQSPEKWINTEILPTLRSLTGSKKLKVDKGAYPYLKQVLPEDLFNKITFVDGEAVTRQFSKEIEGIDNFMFQLRIGTKNDDDFKNSIDKLNFGKNISKINGFADENGQEVGKNLYKSYIEKTYFSDLVNKFRTTKVNKAMEKQLINIFSEFGGIRVKDLSEIKEKLGVDTLGVYDILNKIIYAAKEGRNTLTLPEEFGHALIAMLGSRHPLRQGMIEELMKNESEFLKRVTEEYSDVYKGNRQKIIDEALGQLVGAALIKQFDKFGNKTLLDKVLAFIQKVIDFFKNVKTEDFDNIFTQAAQYIYQKDFDKIMKGASPNPENLQSYLKTLEKQTAKDGGVAVNIMKDLTDLGGSISGSLAYRSQGTIYRAEDNMLHDIDVEFFMDDVNSSQIRSQIAALNKGYVLDRGEWFTPKGSEILGAEYHLSDDEINKIVELTGRPPEQTVYNIDLIFNPGSKKDYPIIHDNTYNWDIAHFSSGFMEKLYMQGQKHMLDYINFRAFDPLVGVQLDEYMMYQLAKDSDNVTSKLPKTLEAGNVKVVKSLKDLKEGDIFADWARGREFHYGSPYHTNPTKIAELGLTQVKDMHERLKKYAEWIMTSEDTRAVEIRKMIQSGELEGKRIITLGRDVEAGPSEANVLDYLINEYKWPGAKRNKKKIIENLADYDQQILNDLAEKYNLPTPLKPETLAYLIDEYDVALGKKNVSELIQVEPKKEVELGKNHSAEFLTFIFDKITNDHNLLRVVDALDNSKDRKDFIRSILESVMNKTSNKYLSMRNIIDINKEFVLGQKNLKKAIEALDAEGIDNILAEEILSFKFEYAKNTFKTTEELNQYLQKLRKDVVDRFKDAKTISPETAEFFDNLKKVHTEKDINTVNTLINSINDYLAKVNILDVPAIYDFTKGLETLRTDYMRAKKYDVNFEKKLIQLKNDAINNLIDYSLTTEGASDSDAALMLALRMIEGTTNKAIIGTQSAHDYLRDLNYGWIPEGEHLAAPGLDLIVSAGKEKAFSPVFGDNDPKKYFITSLQKIFAAEIQLEKENIELMEKGFAPKKRPGDFKDKLLLDILQSGGISLNDTTDANIARVFLSSICDEGYTYSSILGDMKLDSKITLNDLLINDSIMKDYGTYIRSFRNRDLDRFIIAYKQRAQFGTPEQLEELMKMGGFDDLIEYITHVEDATTFKVGLGKAKERINFNFIYEALMHMKDTTIEDATDDVMRYWEFLADKGEVVPVTKSDKKMISDYFKGKKIPEDKEVYFDTLDAKLGITAQLNSLKRISEARSKVAKRVEELKEYIKKSGKAEQYLVKPDVNTILEALSNFPASDYEKGYILYHIYGGDIFGFPNDIFSKFFMPLERFVAQSQVNKILKASSDPKAFEKFNALLNRKYMADGMESLPSSDYAITLAEVIKDTGYIEGDVNIYSIVSNLPQKQKDIIKNLARNLLNQDGAFDADRALAVKTFIDSLNMNAKGMADKVRETELEGTFETIYTDPFAYASDDTLAEIMDNFYSVLQKKKNSLVSIADISYTPGKPYLDLAYNKKLFKLHDPENYDKAFKEFEHPQEKQKAFAKTFIEKESKLMQSFEKGDLGKMKDFKSDFRTGEISEKSFQDNIGQRVMSFTVRGKNKEISISNDSKRAAGRDLFTALIRPIIDIKNGKSKSKTLGHFKIDGIYPSGFAITVDNFQNISIIKDFLNDVNLDKDFVNYLSIDKKEELLDKFSGQFKDILEKDADVQKMAKLKPEAYKNIMDILDSFDSLDPKIKQDFLKGFYINQSVLSTLIPAEKESDIFAQLLNVAGVMDHVGLEDKIKYLSNFYKSRFYSEFKAVEDAGMKNAYLEFRRLFDGGGLPEEQAVKAGKDVSMNVYRNWRIISKKVQSAIMQGDISLTTLFSLQAEMQNFLKLTDSFGMKRGKNLAWHISNDLQKIINLSPKVELNAKYKIPFLLARIDNLIKDKTPLFYGACKNAIEMFVTQDAKKAQADIFKKFRAKYLDLEQALNNIDDLGKALRKTQGAELTRGIGTGSLIDSLENFATKIISNTQKAITGKGKNKIIENFDPTDIRILSVDMPASHNIGGYQIGEDEFMTEIKTVDEELLNDILENDGLHKETGYFYRAPSPDHFEETAKFTFVDAVDGKKYLYDQGSISQIVDEAQKVVVTETPQWVKTYKNYEGYLSTHLSERIKQIVKGEDFVSKGVDADSYFTSIIEQLRNKHGFSSEQIGKLIYDAYHKDIINKTDLAKNVIQKDIMSLLNRDDFDKQIIQTIDNLKREGEVKRAAAEGRFCNIPQQVQLQLDVL